MYPVDQSALCIKMFSDCIRAWEQGLVLRVININATRRWQLTLSNQSAAICALGMESVDPTVLEPVSTSTIDFILELSTNCSNKEGVQKELKHSMILDR